MAATKRTLVDVKLALAAKYESLARQTKSKPQSLVTVRFSDLLPGFGGLGNVASKSFLIQRKNGGGEDEETN